MNLIEEIRDLSPKEKRLIFRIVIGISMIFTGGILLCLKK